MKTLADLHIEQQLRRKGDPYENERERMARIVAASRSRDAKESRIRPMAARLGDFVAGLRCKLQSRFASEPTAPAVSRLEVRLGAEADTGRRHPS